MKNKEMRVSWAKPFRIIKVGEIYKPSIVAYCSVDWLMLGNKVIERKHRLYINLWIVELLFEWIRKSPLKETK
jgi:hypothetical protein